MEKQYYALYLNPCRPDFAMTMTADELAIMQQHIAYWQPYLENGTMLVMGPVLEPAAAFGLGVVRVDNEEELKTLLAADPATQLHSYEYYPMLNIMVGKL